MSEPKMIEILRDCEAVRIPAGGAVSLRRGAKVFLTQSLGGAYTLQLPTGELVRVAGSDAGALGIEVTEEVSVVDRECPTEPVTLETLVWDTLRTCYDPEIPVNIVDLGLVYDMRLSELPEGEKRVDVKMTLTAQGCGMGAAIAGDAQQKLLRLPNVAGADVQIVWEPVWNPNMISPEGRAKLGIG